MELGSESMKLQSFMVYLKPLLENGQIQIGLSVKELLGTKEFLTLVKTLLLKKTGKDNKTIEKIIFMLECHLKNKKMTLKDKKILCYLNSQTVKSLQILVQDLITNERDYESYWIYLLKIKFQELLYSQKTDCVDLGLKCLNGYLKETKQASWFLNQHIKPQKKNLQKTYLLYFKSFLVDGMEKENIKLKSKMKNTEKIKSQSNIKKTNKIIKTKKIKINIHKDQEKILKNWLGIYRFLYNRALNYIYVGDNYKNKIEIKKFGKSKEIPVLVNSNAEYYNKFDLRNLNCPEGALCRFPWTLNLPFCMRAYASFEVSRALDNALEALSSKRVKKFHIKFKKKNDREQTIQGIEANKIKIEDDYTLKIFPKKLAVNPFIRLKEKWFINSRDDKILGSQIKYDGLNWYFLLTLETDIEQTNHKSHSLACDPGIRVFQTCFDVENKKIYEVSKDNSILYNHLIKLDRLISEKAVLENKMKKSYKKYTKKVIRRHKNKKKLLTKKIYKRYDKIQNLQKELHCKTIKWMTDRYKNIIIPLFGSKNMSNRFSRNIGTKTVRNMSVLAHGKFLQRLKTKALEKSVKIHIVNEAYTTRTCCLCSHIQNGIKAKKKWICSNCNTEHLRDVNASVNMFYKNIL